MNTPTIFTNNQFGASRFIQEGDSFVVVAKDVVEGVGNAWKGDAGSIAHVPTQWKVVRSIQTSFGLKDTICLTEEGLYFYLGRCDKPAALQYQMWIAGEVVPSIRRADGYMVSKMDDTPESILARAVLVANDTIERLKNRIEQAKPKELFADSVAGSETGILIGQLAKLICQNGIPIGQNRLFAWMRDNDYLIKQGDQRNGPTQKALEAGLFEIMERTIVPPDGKSRIVTTTKVTGKGQVYFINKFLKTGETSEKELSYAHC